MNGNIMSSTQKPYSYFKGKLFRPSYEDVAAVLQRALVSNFAEVKVEVVKCPDLTKSPFQFGSPGLGGNTSLCACGSMDYIRPKLKAERCYDTKELASLLGLKSAFCIGAGGGDDFLHNALTEKVVNASINGKLMENRSKMLRIDSKTNTHVLDDDTPQECKVIACCDLFYSEGKRDDVLRIHCKKRTGKCPFPSVLQKALKDNYKDECVGLGGTFLVKEGKAMCHVCKLTLDYPPIDSSSFEDFLDKATNFIDMSAPLVAVGLIISQDKQDLGLRLQHFHCYSSHGDGGHFHYDTTPDSIEYVGYFSLVETLMRIDKPE